MSLSQNYFTCTLGQAQLINENKNVLKNINALVDEKNLSASDDPAVGFSEIIDHDSRDGAYFYTFQQVRRGSIFVSCLLADRYHRLAHGSVTCALLSDSSPEFLFLWLALMRLGHSVLLIAPQCPSNAVSHLCKTCQVEILFHDEKHRFLAEKAVRDFTVRVEERLSSQGFGFSTRDESFRQALKVEQSPCNDVESSSTSIAYLFHTSGTSSGLPKPISQTHQGAVTVLPQFTETNPKATFSTTPLYHGGIADLLRAWTSKAMIWLFPSHEIPITARNVCRSLELAAEATSGSPRVAYFSSVPYVLQMMASDTKGVEMLQMMDLVGVGGAALPQDIGDKLVARGINLVSRYGSAECGFLMSSHREYSSDKEWQYLRRSLEVPGLSFEQRDGGTSELVVLPQWPHRAKTNRDDGSYATSDLFAPHSSIPNAWKYHSRADSQLTLITGKKFDPAPLEAALATLSVLKDVLIFGEGRPFPGALLFRSQAASSLTNQELINSVTQQVEDLNRDSPDHARLPRNMLVPMPSDCDELEKSSKGTILRKSAEIMFKGDISKAYDNLLLVGDDTDSSQDIATSIQKFISTVVGRGTMPDLEDDLFSFGVDSVASIQIRYFLQQFQPDGSHELPLNVVDDCGTVRKIVDFLKGQRGVSQNSGCDSAQLMHDLVAQFGHFNQSPTKLDINGSATTKRQKDVVLLTGATGSLGAHTLNGLRGDISVAKIYCLVRGADEKAAQSRIQKSLLQRQLPGLDDVIPLENMHELPDVHILCGKLGDNRLGLTAEQYRLVSTTVTRIIHAAWAVNFRMRLQSFVKDHLAGLHSLLQLGLDRASAHKDTDHSPIKFFFVSSTASISERAQKLQDPGKMAEQITELTDEASPIGYSRSKWVAEQICARAAHEAFRQTVPLVVSIFRVGQLSGDSKHGIWNITEAWPLMLGTAASTGILPKLPLETKLEWLPVDVAAQACNEIASRAEMVGDGSVNVYHIVNAAEPVATWGDVIRWGQSAYKDITGDDLNVVSIREWLEQLKQLEQTSPAHPALKLLGHWQTLYGDGKQQTDIGSSASQEVSRSSIWSIAKASAAAPLSFGQGSLRPVSEEYFQRLWVWIARNCGGQDG